RRSDRTFGWAIAVVETVALHPPRSQRSRQRRAGREHLAPTWQPRGIEHRERFRRGREELHTAFVPELAPRRRIDSGFVIDHCQTTAAGQHRKDLADGPVETRREQVATSQTRFEFQRADETGYKVAE